MTQLVLHHAVNEDILALGSSERLHAVRALRALRDGDVGAYTVDVLGPSRAMLQLEGLCALKCGDAATAPIRIVFREDGDIIEVIAVGPRQRSQVFQSAHYRLHPTPPPRLRLRTHTAADFERSLR